MIDQTTTSFVSALTALVASIAAPLVTLYAARLQIRASVGSANRQRWIDEFRNVIADFCSQMAIAGQGRAKIVSDGQFLVPAEPQFLATYGKLIFAANKIRLMINPLDENHQKLIEVLDRLFERFRNAPDHQLQSEGQQIVGEIVTMSLVIIRSEWVRVQRGE